jgi:hypothetical protein
MNEDDHPSNKRTRLSPKGAMPKGTLYITVGPQCAGKTTILKNIFEKSVRDNKRVVSTPGVDVTIDDQELVYFAVPTSYFLQNSTPSLTGNEYPSPNLKLYGKTIHERIHDPSNYELVLVVMRLGRALGAEEFASRLEGQHSGDTSDQMAARGELIDAMEHVIQLRSSEKEDDGLASLPNAVDLFVAESIFRPRPLDLFQRKSNECTTNQRNTTSASSETLSALDQALHLLKAYAVNSEDHPSSTCLSWGNTNTRPREFQSALEAAALSGRTVEFIVFGGMEACEMIRKRITRREYYNMSHNESAVDKEDTSEKQKILCLPKIDRKTLLVRNLRRFLKTGRYIPSNAISDAIVRVESMLAEVVAETEKDFYHGDHSCELDPKFLLDFELAKLAGYHMNSDRTVTSLNAHGNAQSTWNSHQQPRNSGEQRFQTQAGYQAETSGGGDRSTSKHITHGKQRKTSTYNSERGCEQV